MALPKNPASGKTPDYSYAYSGILAGQGKDGQVYVNEVHGNIMAAVLKSLCAYKHFTHFQIDPIVKGPWGIYPSLGRINWNWNTDMSSATREFTFGNPFCEIDNPSPIIYRPGNELATANDAISGFTTAIQSIIDNDITGQQDSIDAKIDDYYIMVELLLNEFSRDTKTDLSSIASLFDELYTRVDDSMTEAMTGVSDTMSTRLDNYTAELTGLIYEHFERLKEKTFDGTLARALSSEHRIVSLTNADELASSADGYLDTFSTRLDALNNTFSSDLGSIIVKFDELETTMSEAEDSVESLNDEAETKLAIIERLSLLAEDSTDYQTTLSELVSSNDTYVDAINDNVDSLVETVSSDIVELKDLLDECYSGTVNFVEELYAFDGELDEHSTDLFNYITPIITTIRTDLATAKENIIGTIVEYSSKIENLHDTVINDIAALTASTFSELFDSSVTNIDKVINDTYISQSVQALAADTQAEFELAQSKMQTAISALSGALSSAYAAANAHIYNERLANLNKYGADLRMQLALTRINAILQSISLNTQYISAMVQSKLQAYLGVAGSQMNMMNSINDNNMKLAQLSSQVEGTAVALQMEKYNVILKDKLSLRLAAMQGVLEHATQKLQSYIGNFATTNEVRLANIQSHMQATLASKSFKLESEKQKFEQYIMRFQVFSDALKGKLQAALGVVDQKLNTTFQLAQSKLALQTQLIGIQNDLMGQKVNLAFEIARAESLTPLEVKTQLAQLKQEFISRSYGMDIETIMNTAKLELENNVQAYAATIQMLQQTFNSNLEGMFKTKFGIIEANQSLAQVLAGIVSNRNQLLSEIRKDFYGIGLDARNKAINTFIDSRSKYIQLASQLNSAVVSVIMDGVKLKMLAKQQEAEDTLNINVKEVMFPFDLYKEVSDIFTSFKSANTVQNPRMITPRRDPLGTIGNVLSGLGALGALGSKENSNG